MSGLRVFITGFGIVSPVGDGIDSIRRALNATEHEFQPLSLFESGPDGPLPAGQVPSTLLDCPLSADPPRTHQLALRAARQAMASSPEPPQAVILGGTTGGIPTTEQLLLEESTSPERFRLHGTGSVAGWLAGQLGCQGPALTISTACSSSAVALKLALEMLRSGSCSRVLSGGVDGLCRLTYYGFGLLQLIDPDGSRPLDVTRAGMTVSEGAAMLLLQAAEHAPENALAELRGGGLSCDAHHVTAPHPEGDGALAAMRSALTDAGLEPTGVDYINLHGTGTRDNDASEAKAVRRLYPDGPPPLSSTKGIFGHTLAAAGAIEAGVSLVCLQDGLLAPNARCLEPDPDLRLDPVQQPTRTAVGCVLSNSLGFGGNNASLVLAQSDVDWEGSPLVQPRSFAVTRAACLSGVGGLAETLEHFRAGESCAGILPSAEVVSALPPRSVRRMKRLPRIVVALGEAVRPTEEEPSVDEVYFGTGWGPMSETRDFLTRLYADEQRLSSPTDFVGSVHNAPAGQLAMRLAARGPNITATGGDTSFEQALLMASLLVEDAKTPTGVLLVGADEHHPELSALFDPSVAAAGLPADGGGALLLSPRADDPGPCLAMRFFARAGKPVPMVEQLLVAMGGEASFRKRCAGLLVGLPLSERSNGQAILDALLERLGSGIAVVDYRRLLGEYATVSACACVLATELVRAGRLPAALTGGAELDLAGRGVVLLTLGEYASAIEVVP